MEDEREDRQLTCLWCVKPLPVRNEGETHWATWGFCASACFRLYADREQVPPWVMRMLEDVGNWVAGRERQLAALEALHACTVEGREWWMLRGPGVEWPAGEETITLFTLSPDRAQPVCTLSRGDMLFIGRRGKDREGA